MYIYKDWFVDKSVYYNLNCKIQYSLNLWEALFQNFLLFLKFSILVFAFLFSKMREMVVKYKLIIFLGYCSLTPSALYVSLGEGHCGLEYEIIS